MLLVRAAGDIGQRRLDALVRLVELQCRVRYSSGATATVTDARPAPHVDELGGVQARSRGSTCPLSGIAKLGWCDALAGSVG